MPYEHPFEDLISALRRAFYDAAEGWRLEAGAEPPAGCVDAAASAVSAGYGAGRGDDVQHFAEAARDAEREAAVDAVRPEDWTYYEDPVIAAEALADAMDAREDLAEWEAAGPKWFE